MDVREIWANLCFADGSLIERSNLKSATHKAIAMGQDEDLRKRLEALERENRELKAGMNRGAQPGKTIYCSIGDYKGHPTISFEGVGRTFSIGLKKAAVVLRCADELRSFVAAHGALLDGYNVVERSTESRASNIDDSRI